MSVLRTLAVRTLLGPKKEKEINWFLQAGFREKLLAQLNPHLSKIAQIILYCSASVCNYLSVLSFPFIIMSGLSGSVGSAEKISIYPFFFFGE